MAKRGGALLLLLCALFTMNQANATAARHELRVGAFNLRWFGSAEHDQSYQLPSTKAERVAAVKDFLAKEILPLDVISFEEIVDLPALKRALPNGYSCESYSHPNKEHQHVVLCVSAKYSLAKVPYDNDNVINETAYYDADRARPAMRMDLVDQSGQHILRVVGVHLKSAPNFGLLRLKQAGMIGRDLQNDSNIPMLVMGDFNSYTKEKTGLEDDDYKLINNQLNQSGADFRHLDYDVPFTFKHGKETGQFDHFFVNKYVTTATTPQVYSVCNTERDGAGYKNHKHYLQYVSDHCPVTAKIKF